MSENVIWFEHLARGDVARVGGKNSSLGEMVRTLGPKGIDVPTGFATSSDAYRGFIKANNLHERVAAEMDALATHKITLHEAGTRIRTMINAGEWPDDLRADILTAYKEMAKRTGSENPSVAVRSSATAEDLPDASFAGQQETFLNVEGDTALLAACKRCYAS
ncbi:MAG: pyruvate,water dikinase, partial [Paracoccaceae bacterium]